MYQVRPYIQLRRPHEAKQKANQDDQTAQQASRKYFWRLKLKKEKVGAREEHIL